MPKSFTFAMALSGLFVLSCKDGQTKKAEDTASASSSPTSTGTNTTVQRSTDVKTSTPTDTSVGKMTTADGSTIAFKVVVVEGFGSVPIAKVSIGGSKEFSAILDTGSVGLRVVEGVVPEASFKRSTTPEVTSYGTGVVAKGIVAKAVIQMGSVKTTSAVNFQLITAVSCTQARPNCIADGKTAKEFRFRNMYPAILGIGLRQGNVASPLVAMGKNKQHVIKLPHQGGTDGVIEIDPPAADVTAYKPFIALPHFDKAGAVGDSWDDTQVPICVNSFCTKGLIDTGGNSGVLILEGPADFTALGVGVGATQIPPGSALTVGIGSTTPWKVTVGAIPTDQKDLFKLSGGGTVTGRTNLGIKPYFAFDVFCDYKLGHLGLKKKP